MKLRRYLVEMVGYNSDYHRYPSSKRDDCRISRKNSEFARNVVFDKGLSKFYELPMELKNKTNKSDFILISILVFYK